MTDQIDYWEVPLTNAGLCEPHSIIYIRPNICVLCFFLSAENINRRYWIRIGDDHADPLINFETTNIGNGLDIPIILGQTIDASVYLRRFPDERIQFNVPYDYACWLPPWAELPILRTQIPPQRPLRVSAPRAILASMPSLPPSTPVYDGAGTARRRRSASAGSNTWITVNHIPSPSGTTSLGSIPLPMTPNTRRPRRHGDRPIEVARHLGSSTLRLRRDFHHLRHSRRLPARALGNGRLNLSPSHPSHDHLNQLHRPYCLRVDYLNCVYRSGMREGKRQKRDRFLQCCQSPTRIHLPHLPPTRRNRLSYYHSSNRDIESFVD